MRPTRILFRLAPLAAACAAGCTSKAASSFELVSFLQSGSQGVPLNAELVFVFNAPPDPASVFGGGIQIADLEPGGGDVRGRFEVVANERVRFIPAIPSRADLSDAGLKPGHKYQVTVEGFPRASGIRSRSGEVLGARRVFQFQAAAPGADRRTPLFVDHSPLKGPVLTPAPLAEAAGVGDAPALYWYPDAPIVLVADEPLRPDCVVAENFHFKTVEADGSHRVISLQEPELRNSADGARIEIRPQNSMDGFAAATLEVSERVTDLGGNPCRQADGLPVRMEVYPGPVSNVSAVDEEFLSPGALEPRDSDDTNSAAASWLGDGVLTAHCPRAAGDGSDGPVVLGGPLKKRIIRASTLQIPAEADVQLDGPLLLGSASTTVLLGKLRVRHDSATDTAPERAELVPGVWSLAVVAAGDLVVRGKIQCDGPVVLAAGGSVRIESTASVECPRLRIFSPSAPDLSGDVRAAKERDVTRTPLPDATIAPWKGVMKYRATSKWIPAGFRPMRVLGSKLEARLGGAQCTTFIRTARSSGGAGSPVDTKTASAWKDRADELPSGEWIQFRIELSLPGSPLNGTTRFPLVDRLRIDLGAK